MPALGFVLAKSVVGYACLVVAAHMLARLVPRLGFVARVLVTYVTLALTATVNAAASMVLSLLGHQDISQWVAARCFHHAMRWAVGVDFSIDDPRASLATVRPAVFIGNHQTELDVLMLAAMFPKYCSVTAKSNLKHMPFLGWFMRASGTIFIDRANSRGAREAMQGAANEIRSRRQSVYMFPEGTRSYARNPDLLPFKKGAFHLAIQAGVPIVPCVVANYSHILYIKGMVFNSGTIPIKVLDPISTDGLGPDDVDELVRRTRRVMLTEYVALTAKAQGRLMPVPASYASAPSKGVSSGSDAVGASTMSSR